MPKAATPANKVSTLKRKTIAKKGLFVPSPFAFKIPIGTKFSFNKCRKTTIEINKAPAKRKASAIIIIFRKTGSRLF